MPDDHHKWTLISEMDVTNKRDIPYVGCTIVQGSKLGTVQNSGK